MALATYTCEQLRQATDGYSDSRILGQGGFGVVYSGKVHDSPVPVAVKRIMLNDKKKAKMKSFSREIACAGVTGRHPNLVDVVGMCKDSADELALVYAPVASTSLANTLLPAGKAEVTLLPLERINIALSVVKGLQALHDARQIHLDIKSANVLLIDRRGEKAVLADMGVSAALDPDCDTISFSPPDGDYPYWAPEYSKMGEASFAADIYCFGLILVELYMGTLLYLKPDQTNACIGMVASLSENVANIADTAICWTPSLLKTFLGLASRCLSDDRYARPTAADCVAELAAMLAEPASPAKTPASDVGTPELSSVRRPPSSKPSATQTTTPTSLAPGAGKRRREESAAEADDEGEEESAAPGEQETSSSRQVSPRRLRPRRGVACAAALPSAAD